MHPGGLWVQRGGQLLPPAGTNPLVDAAGRPLDHDLHDPATWERFGWGPFAPKSDGRLAPERAFLVAALERARAFHAALAREVHTPCPVAVHALGGDCLLTLARAVAGVGPPGTPPRLEARTRRELVLAEVSLLIVGVPPSGAPILTTTIQSPAAVQPASDKK